MKISESHKTKHTCKKATKCCFELLSRVLIGGLALLVHLWYCKDSFDPVSMWSFNLFCSPLEKTFLFFTHSLCMWRAWSHPYQTCIHPSFSLVIDVNYFYWSSVLYPYSLVSLWSLRWVSFLFLCDLKSKSVFTSYFKRPLSSLCLFVTFSLPLFPCEHRREDFMCFSFLTTTPAMESHWWFLPFWSVFA